MAHGDTLENLLEEVPHEKISHIRTDMIRTLIRSRIFDNHRLLEKYYLIAVDGSGIRYYSKRHCEHCLTKESKKTGVTTYYHSLLEVRQVTDNGLALSINTEFIENATKDMDKQDCELRAFYRLAPRLKNVSSITSVQKGNRFNYILPDKTKQEYKFATDIEHGKQKFNAIHCTEYKPKGTKQYAYMTNISVNSDRCVAIVNQGGRIRWKIENQGFNTQKKGGYELEHAYLENENATKVMKTKSCCIRGKRQNILACNVLVQVLSRHRFKTIDIFGFMLWYILLISLSDMLRPIRWALSIMLFIRFILKPLELNL